ncbi:hypothetical protein [Ekhidna sp.]|uniref:hypothetical protein n=1 Tax=Ekhidna sp. TaxID=2608089 RepID=UPI003BA95F8B
MDSLLEEDGFKGVRKNLMLISILIIFLSLSYPQLNEFNLLGVVIKIPSGTAYGFILISYTYYTFRYWQELKLKKYDLKKLINYRLQKILNTELENATSKVKTEGLEASKNYINKILVEKTLSEDSQIVDKAKNILNSEILLTHGFMFESTTSGLKITIDPNQILITRDGIERRLSDNGIGIHKTTIEPRLKAIIPFKNKAINQLLKDDPNFIVLFLPIAVWGLSLVGILARMILEYYIV